ncbi:MAG: hypothetical protein GJ676_07920 [Rhodobacteraceae bacterium]|nr:hypothetical protein [Paracoccaceae bacterium]
MSFFSDDEKIEIGKGIADLLKTALGSPELRVAEEVDDALAFIKKKRAHENWTVEMGQIYLEFVTENAVATLSASRKLKKKKVRKAIKGILTSLVGVVNERIGFPILPTP